MQQLKQVKSRFLYFEKKIVKSFLETYLGLDHTVNWRENEQLLNGTSALPVSAICGAMKSWKPWQQNRQ